MVRFVIGLKITASKNSSLSDVAGEESCISEKNLCKCKCFMEAEFISHFGDLITKLVSCMRIMHFFLNPACYTKSYHALPICVHKFFFMPYCYFN